MINDASFLSAEHIAIGMVGSSDIASNVLVGGVSDRLLGAAGWGGYFPCVAAVSSVAVVAATALFPDRKDDVRQIDRNVVARSLSPPDENLKLGFNCKIFKVIRGVGVSCHATRSQGAGRRSRSSRQDLTEEEEADRDQDAGRQA